MPKDYVAEPINAVRRRDRAVTDEAWIRDFLHRAPMGVLATINDGQPFMNTNLFVFDEPSHVIYTHSARFGRTRSNVEQSKPICFSVSEMGRLLPAKIALEFSVEYIGVTVFGQVMVVEDTQEAHRALQLLLDKYFGHLRPGQDYRPPIAEELERTSVYRITIERWSGKQKAVALDFPGAFFYEQSTDSP
ncbi:MAG: pyridoxamine 5'-phosphate oxidase family protein [Chloroflexi bacterium AL-W]|nr:pyridoxamine 5'-phosphate oxidase family protein [Chloroflexi bacterium AL-N1]NOK71435.1 pyridoxamine 5'-phosphate oxidase family protein [Chloroflexi bacterium AL-N10]NOK78838.1 pyridoxamine 5'-phosphate oxidase family protein [Chloroflexi bacterium AL-N5]NOK86256.1 pyridoxamine 5'-phosphate oxidase family protein [Chloroflexi bacterium AL-W]NOK93160.1 pyridoxamine 5'-phosphate oxidase family protein [Chloroflexi bacterium AL-N15]